MDQKTNEMIHLAMKSGVSDIHILPNETKYGVYFRVPSGLKKMMDLSSEMGEKYLSYFKFLSNMDIGERRKPQSGSCNIKMNKENIELRISTISNYLYQESMVLRILYSEGNLNQQDMEVFFPKDYCKLEKLLNYKSGLILFSGPVSSGKTTTIYHFLRKQYAKEPLQIITMEDPVEIKEPRFLQSEINERAGLNYEVLIKQSLRHHPDILVIGEIRDEETARMVIRSALTGHLVIATIHAKECTGVIERMLEMDVSYEQLKQSLVGIVSQRMINKNCCFCEGACSIYCEHFPIHYKKAILFEILMGPALKNILYKEGGERPHFVTMNQKLRKAYGCGYITQKDFENHQIF
ncbi:competence type IV pilus ATPase ComGA [Jeotgalibaca ciconiae]|nr:competence type IV pilus ATPase ComGA [Jeotgalibaca ciconiae]